MEADKQIIKDFEHNGKRVEVKVSYNRGDWGGKRGYYVGVQPYEVEEHPGYKTRVTIGFSGVKICLLEVARKSAKRLQEAVEMVNDEMIESMLAQCKFN
jgi:hypothetical protein